MISVGFRKMWITMLAFSNSEGDRKRLREIIYVRVRYSYDTLLHINI